MVQEDEIGKVVLNKVNNLPKIFSTKYERAITDWLMRAVIESAVELGYIKFTDERG